MIIGNRIYHLICFLNLSYFFNDNDYHLINFKFISFIPFLCWTSINIEDSSSSFKTVAGSAETQNGSAETVVGSTETQNSCRSCKNSKRKVVAAAVQKFFGVAETQNRSVETQNGSAETQNGSAVAGVHDSAVDCIWFCWMSEGMIWSVDAILWNVGRDDFVECRKGWSEGFWDVIGRDDAILLGCLVIPNLNCICILTNMPLIGIRHLQYRSASLIMLQISPWIYGPDDYILDG